MGGHTPGPWEICPSFGGNPDAFSISLVGDDRLIATAWDRDAFDRAHPARANAHLIAAAPELLDALDNEVMAECVCAWVTEKGIGKQEYNHRRALAEKIQAAIAKARPAQAGTHPKGRDAKQARGASLSDAVGSEADDAPNPEDHP